MTEPSSDTAALSRHRAAEAPRIAYSVPEAATAVGLGKTTLYSLIGSGELPSSKISGRRLIATADLLALLERNKITAASPAATVSQGSPTAAPLRRSGARSGTAGSATV